MPALWKTLELEPYQHGEFAARRTDRRMPVRGPLESIELRGDAIAVTYAWLARYNPASRTWTFERGRETRIFERRKFIFRLLPSGAIFVSNATLGVRVLFSPTSESLPRLHASRVENFPQHLL